MTQLAIDRGLTLIAWEAMNHWNRDGTFSVHVFHKNNEMAGYCVGPARADAARVDGRLRPPPARRGHQLRRDRARRGQGAVGARRQRRDGVHPAQRLGCRVAVRIGADGALRAAAGLGPTGLTRLRRRRQLRPAGHGRPADLRDERRPRALSRPARSSSTSPATRAWASSGRGRPPSPTRSSRVGHGHALLRGRPQPLLPVELGDVGEQRGAARVPADRPGRAPTRGTPTRRSSARSRSATAASRTRGSCRSRSARRTTRTPSSASYAGATRSIIGVMTSAAKRRSCGSLDGSGSSGGIAM